MKAKMECDIRKYNKSISHRIYLRQQPLCPYLYWFPMELKDLHRRLSTETKNENIGIKKSSEKVLITYHFNKVFFY